MLLVVFGLVPTVVSIMAAVCGVRLGVCALYGQICYLLVLLAFSIFSPSVTTVWLIFSIAGVFFLCGGIAAFFMVRRDLARLEGRNRLLASLGLVLCNLWLLFFLPHNFFSLICLRLDHLPQAEAVSQLMTLNAAAALCLILWALFWLFLRFRRMGLCVLYAWPGLAFSSYFQLSALARPAERSLSPELLKALDLQSLLPLFYQIIPPESSSENICLLPVLTALLAGLLGFFLLEPAGAPGHKLTGRENCF